MNGTFCDLLWSDPCQNMGGKVDNNSAFGYNRVRQCSYIFGANATQQFLDNNKLQSVIRAHEVQL